jgi:hypothetical protein
MTRLVWRVSALCLVAACAAESPALPLKATPITPPPAQPSAAGAAGRASGGAGSAAAGAGGTSDAPGTLNAEVILASGCARETELVPLLPPSPSNILFVIDRSGSMACNAPPLTSSEACELDPKRADPKVASKWELTSQALLSALETLPDSTSVGVSYFSNDDACGVHSIPNVPLSHNTPAQRSSLVSSLAAIKPNGSTPLVGATVLAYRYMHDTALAGTIQGSKYVVLITDGKQSEACGDVPRCKGADACTDLLVNQDVPKALADGVNIRTFVVGVPGSEAARTVLSQIAKNGGTAAVGCDASLGNCHFDMTRERELGAALQRALQKIAGQTLTCDLALPRPKSGPVDLKLVNVVFTPNQARARVLPQDNHAPCDGGADGWQYNAANDQIRLCGDTCTAVRGDRGARIDVVLGCPVIGPD